jgi:hypothetical protein
MVKKFAADPNAPKRPLSAYFLFCADVRDTVVDNMSGKFSIGKVGKKIGQMWAALSKNKKAPYQKKAEAAHAKWQKANEKYQKTDGYTAHCAAREEHKKAAKAQEKRNALKALLPNKPKRGLSSYMRFCNANRSKHNGSLTENAQALGKAWATASAAVKGKFQKQVDADNKKYEKAMAKYVQTEEYKTYEEAFKLHRTEQYKVRTYGSVAAANKAERARLAARASKKRENEKKAKARAKARKAAIRA